MQNLTQKREIRSNSPWLTLFQSFWWKFEILRQKQRPHNERTQAHKAAHTRTRAYIEKVYFLIFEFSDYLAVFGIKLYHFAVQHASISSAFDSKLAVMMQRMHSTNTLVEGMTKVSFGENVATRKRELELKIEEPCQTCDSHMC